MSEKQSNKYQKNFDIIALYLKELRYWEYKSQMEVGTESFLHRNTVLRAENAHNFTLLTLFQLSDYYSLKPSEILSIID